MADLLTTAALVRSGTPASFRPGARSAVPEAGVGDRPVSQGAAGHTNLSEPQSHATPAARIQPVRAPLSGSTGPSAAVSESVAFHAQLLGQRPAMSREPETKSDPVWTEAAVAYRRTLAFSTTAEALVFVPRGRAAAGTGLGAEIDLNG